MSAASDYKHGRRAGHLFAIFAVMICSPSAIYAGFLDQLFGAPAQVQAPQAPAIADQPATGNDGASKAKSRHRLHLAKAEDSRRAGHEKVVVAKIANQQNPTSITADKTLRPGDAIMQADGVKIYLGPVAGKRGEHEFVPLQTARNIAPETRKKLIAMLPTEATRASAAPTFGRSSSTVLIVRGFEIADRRSGSVRYVGP